MSKVTGKGFPLSPVTCLLFPAFCLLSSAFISFVACPSLSASDPEPGMVQGGGWAATYGGANTDRAYSIQETHDGGYIVAGWTDSFVAVDKIRGRDRDVWILKLKPDGAVEWQKTYGGANEDEAYCVQQTGDGGYIVAGLTLSFVAGSLWVLKLGADGSVEWQKAYWGENVKVVESIQETRDGGYIMAGKTIPFAPGSSDLWVSKLRADGAVEWEKTYGGERWDEAHSIQETSDGGYIVAGKTGSFGAGKDDIWLLKLRPDGTIEWQKGYGGANGDGAESIHQTGDGGYIVVGKTQSFGTEGRGGEIWDFWVLKLRPDGMVEWQKTYGGKDWDWARYIQETRNGGYIVAGSTASFGGGDFDLWVLKLRADGAVEWQKTYGGVKEDHVCSIRETSDGGYIVAGETWSFGAGEGDIWVLKLRPDGSIAPSCDFVRDTSISGKDSTATGSTTRATRIIRDINVIPIDTSATVRDTNIPARILCP